MLESSLNCSVPQFPHLPNVANDNLTQQDCKEEVRHTV
jgi:hypothetical protein